MTSALYRHLAMLMVTAMTLIFAAETNPQQRKQQEIHPDIVALVNVVGLDDTGDIVLDSYSVDDSCYCASTFDDGIGTFYVETELGWMTVRQICDLLGTGPGIEGRPVYNDVQCGNGPPSEAFDEFQCPGRVDIGPEGCGQIGPKWNFQPFLNESVADVTPPSDAHPDIVALVNVTGEANPGGVGWMDSYSVGDSCYCATTFDHDIDVYFVETPLGWRRIDEICNLLEPGPGFEGNPVYNDIQCGNGPPNTAGDEHTCPGRTDIGAEGCGHIGPKWDFSPLLEEETAVPSVSPSTLEPSTATPTASPSLQVSPIPTGNPTLDITGSPTMQPSASMPNPVPTIESTAMPSMLPTPSMEDSPSSSACWSFCCSAQNLLLRLTLMMLVFTPTVLC